MEEGIVAEDVCVNCLNCDFFDWYDIINLIHDNLLNMNVFDLYETMYYNNKIMWITKPIG